MTQLRAGMGRVHLTPAIGAWLVGFAGRASGCTSVHDDLYATALVLDNGDEQMAILSCDVISINRPLIRATRDLVHAATGIPPQNIMICCSHTHSGPPGYASSKSQPIDQAYSAYLPYRLAGAVQLAWNTRQPARWGHDSGTAVIGINRREVVGEGKTILGVNPDGPVDHEVGVLRVDTLDGAPLAVVVSHACHPVILGPRSLAVSADWVGQARAVVEGATGASMLFIQGACGDINPLGGVKDNYANCHKLGTILGGEVVRVFGGIEPERTEARLAGANRDLELPSRPIPGEPEGLSGAWADPDLFEKEFPWTAEMGEGGAKSEIQALAVDDLAIISSASEPFVETGLAVKEGSPFARTFFAGYTNGCVGYVPTAHAYPHRGYEVIVAHRAYRLPAPVVEEAEQMVVDGCLDLLAQVRG